MPIIEARNRLTTLPEQFEQEGDSGVVAVTRRGKPVLAIMPWELYEALAETLEMLGDQQLTTVLRQSLREADEENLIPWDTARAQLTR